jgi:uncharacterized alkaline shock family protein YloU
MTPGTAREVARVAAEGEGSQWDPVRPNSGTDSGRGTTVVLPRVVERVAVQAVREVAGAAGSGRRVLGHAVGSTGISDPATVRAHVDGAVVSLDVEMTVVYPAPVLAVSRRTRHHIIDRIVELTGLSVRRIDITVVGMSVERPANRRVR